MIRDNETEAQLGREEQLKRYEALAALGSFDGKSVLEIGCGSGDFYRYLRQAGARLSYTGVDLRPEAVAECRGRFRDDADCRFEAGDTFHYQPSAPFDYVVACGDFGFTAPDAAGLLSPALTRLFSWCTLGMAAAFPSMRSPVRPAHQARIDPAAAVKAALRLTPAVRLAHDYLPVDFTVYLYRVPAWQAAPMRGANS
jgi:trans-aconitate methyltransferase